MLLSKRNAIYLLLIIIGSFLLFKAPVDPDFGWHYKYGEYFFKTGHILRENIFSYTFTDYKWVDTYWLFEVILFVTNNFLGLIVSSLALSILLSIFLVLLLKRQVQDILTTALVFILLVALLSLYSVTIRPHIYSSVFLLILLYILIYKKRLPVWLPVIFLVWTNLHADFVLALFILGIYSANEFVNRVKGTRLFSVGSLKTLLSILTLPFLCFLATFINPYGINLWLTLVKEVTLPVKSYVSEWAPFGVSDFENLAFLGFYYASSLMSSWTVKKTENRNFGWWYKFLAIFFFIFSVKAAYVARIFFLLTSFALALQLEKFVLLFFKILNEKNIKLLEKSLGFLLAFTALASSMEFINSLKLTSNIKAWSDKGTYPYEAVNYVKQNPIRGNMLNFYNWGGYLIWQLPQYKTFIDGRMTSWRENNVYFIQEYIKISREPEKNPELLEKYIRDYNITWVIETPKSKLISYLKEKQADRWESVYEDKNAIILVKNQ
jgi:hypothetical protein